VAHESCSRDRRGKILELRQSVSHGKYCLCIVDVQGGSEAEGWHRACKYVDQLQRRVIGHQMSSAFGAVLLLACGRLLEHADMFGSSLHVHGLRSPQCKGVDWST